MNQEPRVADLRLAQALGFTDIHMIRRLIERHRGSLERFGIILSTADRLSVIVTENASRRGRPGKTYWLNKKQALYLCTKSEAPLATETTIQMVEVFDAWHQGQLPALRSETLPPWIMMFRVGQRTVMIDARDYLIGPGDEAVVCAHDGKLSIQRGPFEPNHNAPWMGARSAMGPWVKPGSGSHYGTTTERHSYTVLGRLIEAGERRRRIAA